MIIRHDCKIMKQVSFLWTGSQASHSIRFPVRESVNTLRLAPILHF